MRTTIDLPQDLHSVLTSLASSRRKTLSQTAVELMQRGLASAPATKSLSVSVSPRTGLPQVHFPRTVTPEDVRALDDEG